MVFSLNSYCTIINLCTNDIFFTKICCIIYVDTRHYCTGYTNDHAGFIKNFILYVSILWVPKDSGIGGTIGEIIKFNPVYFLVNHIATILFHEWYFIEHWKLLLYNVIVILIFFVLGSILHRRYRDHFADFL